MTDERIWLAEAPPGRMSFGGPAVAFTEQAAEEWRNMGWKVQGPYVLEERVDQLQCRVDAALAVIDSDGWPEGDLKLDLVRQILSSVEHEVTSDA